MKHQTIFAAGIAVCLIATASAISRGSGKSAPQLPSPTLVATLRDRGPTGLEEAIARYDSLMHQLATLKAEEQEDQLQTLAAWRDAIDHIGGQRSCTVSRLYWYTSWDAARAAAEQTGRPILSLRMLGKLTDEYSCANSRFFRTALYANEGISKYLRDNYVLHWQSVRPVPRVTIDFGDGRKLERTVTGNSAHYVLTADGKPLDALPGLYSPRGFGTWLERMKSFHDQYVATDNRERQKLLAAYHEQRRGDVVRAWADDVRELGEEPRALVESRVNGAMSSALRTGEKHPLAAAAAKVAVMKSEAEFPLLRFANYAGPWVEAGMDDELWRGIANLQRPKTRLDDASIELMREEFPRATNAGRLAITKSFQEDPVLRMVRMFEDSIALDTVRNEYLLHRRIHERFATGAPNAIDDVGALNDWVYAELFLTPSSDPWLGLAPSDVYTALDNGGQYAGEEPRMTRRGE